MGTVLKETDGTEDESTRDKRQEFLSVPLGPFPR